MQFPSPKLEISHQSFPPLADANIPLAESEPLHELAADAWQLDYSLYNINDVRFPFSNDECTAPYFEQLQARTNTADYRSSKNRVALLIGESSLAANIASIPEDTIIVFDKSPDMCSYMEDYVTALRESTNLAAWLENVLKGNPSRHYLGLLNQIDEWSNKGYIHPLYNNDAFQGAKKAANEKAIIPWFGDITSSEDIGILGNALEDHDATITFMNLTNVIAVVSKYSKPSTYAELLATLPVSEYAPIMATNLTARMPQNEYEALALATGDAVAQAVGPFFGIQNLLQACQGNDDAPIIKREYFRQEQRSPRPERHINFSDNTNPAPVTLSGW